MKRDKSEKSVTQKKTLLELLRQCPIDEETWKVILDRPKDLPRDFSFDDFILDDELVKEAE